MAKGYYKYRVGIVEPREAEAWLNSLPQPEIDGDLAWMFHSSVPLPGFRHQIMLIAVKYVTGLSEEVELSTKA